jgi:urocanate hydratase
VAQASKKTKKAEMTNNNSFTKFQFPIIKRVFPSLGDLFVRKAKNPFRFTCLRPDASVFLRRDSSAVPLTKDTFQLLKWEISL